MDQVHLHLHEPYNVMYDEWTIFQFMQQKTR